MGEPKPTAGVSGGRHGRVPEERVGTQGLRAGHCQGIWGHSTTLGDEATRSLTSPTGQRTYVMGCHTALNFFKVVQKAKVRGTPSVLAGQAGGCHGAAIALGCQAKAKPSARQPPTVLPRPPQARSCPAGGNGGWWGAGVPQGATTSLRCPSRWGHPWVLPLLQAKSGAGRTAELSA